MCIDAHSGNSLSKSWEACIYSFLSILFAQSNGGKENEKHSWIDCSTKIIGYEVALHLGILSFQVEFYWESIEIAEMIFP